MSIDADIARLIAAGQADGLRRGVASARESMKELQRHHANAPAATVEAWLAWADRADADIGKQLEAARAGAEAARRRLYHPAQLLARRVLAAARAARQAWRVTG